MLIINHSKDIITKINALKAANKTIGFVPTMGALHMGHQSLVKASIKDNDITIVSVFVNPTQFNDKKDYELYSRDIDADAKKLKSSGADILFYPDVKDMYPRGAIVNENISLQNLDKIWEGAFRPGHFEGVATVVKILLDIVRPNRLYMGIKDFQQTAVVQVILDQFHPEITMVKCKTKREKGGLAMSSRNERLSIIGRQTASSIYRTLQGIKRKAHEKDIKILCANGIKRLTKKGFIVEYLAAVDAINLEEVQHLPHKNDVMLIVAAWWEGVRLIDNIKV